jgi:hypothetical protein
MSLNECGHNCVRRGGNGQIPMSDQGFRFGWRCPSADRCAHLDRMRDDADRACASRNAAIEAFRRAKVARTPNEHS